jgi:hypothetical protein
MAPQAKNNKEQHEKASCQLEACTTTLAITTSEAQQKLREMWAKHAHHTNQTNSKPNIQTAKWQLDRMLGNAFTEMHR